MESLRNRRSTSTYPQSPSNRSSPSPDLPLLAVYRDRGNSISVEKGMDFPCLQQRKLGWCSKFPSRLSHVQSMQAPGAHLLLTCEKAPGQPQDPLWEQPRIQSHTLNKKQLLLTAYEMLKLRDTGKQLDVVILHFAKAFDKVPHHQLLGELDFYGIRGHLLTWAETFLIGRTWSVLLDGIRPKEEDVHSPKEQF